MVLEKQRLALETDFPELSSSGEEEEEERGKGEEGNLEDDLLGGIEEESVKEVRLCFYYYKLFLV